MKSQKLLSLVLIFVLTIGKLKSQNDTDPPIYRIETTQGNEFVGSIIEDEPDYIILKTEPYGELKIWRRDIVRMRTIDQKDIREGVYWPKNPQSTRYFWSPNGYGLEKGEGYYQNIWVFYNQVSYGVTNNFSLSAGMIPLFLFDGAPTPVWIVPKVSIPIQKDDVNLGAGMFIGNVLGESDSGFGIAFGSITLGNPDRNVNIATGWGYSGRDWARKPVVNVSFMTRVGPRGYLISENYLLPERDFNILVFSFGGRSIIRNVSLDYSLVVPFIPEWGGLLALPFLGITVPISGN